MLRPIIQLSAHSQSGGVLHKEKPAFFDHKLDALTALKTTADLLALHRYHLEPTFPGATKAQRPRHNIPLPGTKAQQVVPQAVSRAA